MGFKRFILKHFSFDKPLNKRISLVMLMCAIIGNVLGAFESFFIELPLVAKILPVCAVVILTILLILGFKTEKTRAFNFVSIFITTSVIFPLMFFANGGFQSGMPFYLLVSSVFIVFGLKGAARIILFIIDIAEIIVLCFVYFHYPQIFPVIAPEVQAFDISASLVVAFLVMYSFAYFVRLQHEYDNRKIKELSELYKLQANTDELTNLYNRRYFKDFLKIAISTLGDTGQLHLAMFDIDDFKVINDKFGHLYGDEVLKKFAAILIEESHDNIFACRYGGEEFLILIPKKTSKQALEVVERILQKTRDRIIYDEKHSVTVSAGFITYKNNMTYDVLLQTVDANLYKAKFSGKDRVCY
ncbi:MAG: GGDEF domain-containing protein [Treponema sp.]|nr:GGDEF domain-containing protein [Treponema sp.]